jgi:hypothetical protein
MKVAYSSMVSGVVLGKVVREGRDMLGDFVVVKVTSKTNKTYPYGYEFPVAAGSPWLTER